MAMESDRMDPSRVSILRLAAAAIVAFFGACGVFIAAGAALAQIPAIAQWRFFIWIPFGASLVAAVTIGAVILDAGRPREPSKDSAAISLPDPSDSNFVEACRQLAEEPKPLLGQLPLLVVTFAFFAFANGFRGSALDLALLVAVLLFHEAGHLAGMKMFGFHDLKVFFVPFV